MSENDSAQHQEEASSLEHHASFYLDVCREVEELTYCVGGLKQGFKTILLWNVIDGDLSQDDLERLHQAAREFSERTSANDPLRIATIPASQIHQLYKKYEMHGYELNPLKVREGLELHRAGEHTDPAVSEVDEQLIGGLRTFKSHMEEVAERAQEYRDKLQINDNDESLSILNMPDEQASKILKDITLSRLLTPSAYSRIGPFRLMEEPYAVLAEIGVDDRSLAFDPSEITLLDVCVAVESGALRTNRHPLAGVKEDSV